MMDLTFLLALYHKKRKKREQNQMVLGVVGWIGGGVAAVGVCAALIYMGIIPGFGKKNTKVAVVDPIKEDPGKSNIENPSEKGGQNTRKPPRKNDNNPNKRRRKEKDTLK